jgi:hypothetical protein
MECVKGLSVKRTLGQPRFLAALLGALAPFSIALVRLSGYSGWLTTRGCSGRARSAGSLSVRRR